MLTYRNPKVFVQFIGERPIGVGPSHIVSARTLKTMGDSTGAFEVAFRTTNLSDGDRSTPVPSGNVPNDYWLNIIRPMTVAVIAMGVERDIDRVQTLLSTIPQGITPDQFYDRAPAETKALIDKVVVMVGLVEESAINRVMGANGPENVLRVAGRDFSRMLMDDSLRRIARATGENTRERRIVTLGAPGDLPGPVKSVQASDRDRLLDRASLTQQNQFWRDLSRQGTESKILMKEAVKNILENTPSVNVTLANGAPLTSYFNTAPIVDTALEGVTVRAVLSLFTYSGPVWQAITQLAPAPLAEVYIDTIGLKNVLQIRRPPFYRPSLMGSMATKMRQFLQQIGRPAGEVTKVLDAVQRDLFTDQFAEWYHEIPQADVIGLALSRSSSAVFSQYQVIPSLLMSGQMGDYAAFQGVTASYLYDLPTAVRFGSRVLQAICPWDISIRSQSYAAQLAAEDAKRKEIADAGNDADKIREINRRYQDEAVSQEQTLSASETVRLYYYMRDSSAFLNGTVTVPARPEIRIGHRVYLPGYDHTIAYVESVQHTFQYGQPFLTQLAVSRGQPLNPTTPRLVSYDVENPTMAVTQEADREAVS